MTANIIDSIINIVKTEVYDLHSSYVGTNRANAMGDALERYVTDSFANVITGADENARNEKLSQTFSYLGNDTNPPDAMIRGGSALEVKKIQSRNSQLQLNSSNPKSKLYADNPRITRSAVKAEEWAEKDFVYAVGLVLKNKYLRELALIDASVYCADTEVYTTVFEKIKSGLASIPNTEFSETKELGRLNRVDPLGITNFRIRGMWLLDNPFTVFKYIYQPEVDKNFNLFGLISAEKYKSSENAEILEKMAKEIATLNIEDVKVKNPNNPAQLIQCKKIIFNC